MGRPDMSSCGHHSSGGHSSERTRGDHRVGGPMHSSSPTGE